MQKLIELKKDDHILVSSQVESYLKPDFVYLPICETDQFVVRKNDFVCIGDLLLKAQKDVLSPISGVVRGVKKMNSVHRTNYYLEIENDFLETRREIVLKKDNKKQIIAEKLELDGKKNLVLSAIDDEIYVLTKNFYLFLHSDLLLEFLDQVREMYSLEQVYLCVKASSSENINRLMSELGMYPELILKVVPDLYLLGRRDFLLSYLELDSKDTAFVNTRDFYDLYYYVFRGRTNSEKLITISGNGILNPMIVQVKLGVKLKDVIDEFISVLDDVLYFANGLMGGTEISLDSFVVTEDLDSLLIMKRQNRKKSGECICCGLCNDVCPVGLKPSLFQNLKYYELVKEQCINCGLCSYICPVYISFRRGEKDE